MADEIKIKANIEVSDETAKTIVDAALDTFSAATELLGWLGDSIRVHRARAALRCFERTREMASNAGLKLTVPPAKFLIQYIEHCSLESEEDSNLIEWWASLLVSASSAFDGKHIYFTNALKQITRSELELLEVLVRNGRVNRLGEYGAYGIGQIVDAEIAADIRLGEGRIVLADTLDDELVAVAIESLISAYEFPGALVLDLHVFVDDYEWRETHEDFKESEIYHWQILQSLQLVRMERLVKEVGDVEYQIRRCVITELGAEFYFACHDESVRKKTSDSFKFSRSST